MMRKFTSYIFAAFLFHLLSIPLWASDFHARVTLLNGEAHKSGDGKGWSPIHKGDSLVSGDTVKTGAGARLELLLPDNSKIRFSENTKFKIESLSFKDKDRDVGLRLQVGRIWAKVSKTKKVSKFEVRTANAVAGVRGTTYRIDANEDRSAVVKVYDGEVSVGNPSVGKGVGSGKASYVEGPTEVPGPHEVTLEEWTYIVKSWQQISISSAGVASKPVSFDREKDMDDWVAWNRRLDE